MVLHLEWNKFLFNGMVISIVNIREMIKFRLTKVPAFITVVLLLVNGLSYGQFSGDTAVVYKLNREAWNAFNNKMYDSVYFYADSAIKISREISYKKGKADAFYIIAQTKQEQGDLIMAMRYYFGSIREYEVGNDSIKAAMVKIKIGKIFREANMYQKALEYYLSAENDLLDIDKTEEEYMIELINDIGELYFDLKNYEKSLSYFQRLEKIYFSSGDSLAGIEASQKIIECYNSLGQYDMALSYNMKMLDYYKAQGNIEKEIVALNNTGFTYKRLKNFKEALNYFNMALALEEESGKNNNYVTLLNIAIVYQNLDDYKHSLDYMLRAEKIAESSGDKFEAAQMDHLTSIIYYNAKDYYNAQIYNKEALRLAKESDNTSVLLDALLISSKINEALYDFETAMDDYRLYLKISDSLMSAKNGRKRELLEQQFVIDRSEREIEKLLADEDLKDAEYQRLKLENASKEQQIQIFRQNDSIQRMTIEKQQLEKDKVLQEKLLAEEKYSAELKDIEIKDLRQKEKIQDLQLKNQEYIQKEQENKITLLNKEKELSDLNLKKIRARNKFLFGIVALALIILYLVYRMLKFSKKANKLLIQQNNEIERQRDQINYEHERSEKLLLNILPKETAEELKEKGAATPKHYEMVSVLFTDFVGFTKIAEKLTAEQLVEELNKCFLEFDKIIDKHGLEKIKTIGDAYMCAGGIPVPNTTNPVDIVRAGLEIRDFMARLKREKQDVGKDFWELRIGIHTGDVIAGVVGKNKFAYDIWGDAVNTASRMESSGVPGKVNISGDTYELIKDKFRCTYRGKVKAKNKGEIDMYIVEEEI